MSDDTILGLPITGEIKRLDLNEGDTLVLKTANHLSAETIERIRHELTTRHPGHKVMILGPGMDLEILHPGGAKNHQT